MFTLNGIPILSDDELPRGDVYLIDPRLDDGRFDDWDREATTITVGSVEHPLTVVSYPEKP